MIYIYIYYTYVLLYALDDEKALQSCGVSGTHHCKVLGSREVGGWTEPIFTHNYPLQTLVSPFL